MRAYSRDLRAHVLAHGDAGQSSLEVAKIFHVSSAWVRRLRQRRRELGTIDPLPPPRGHPSQITPEHHHQQFRQILAQKPDTTLAELKAATGLSVHVGQICRVLKKLDLSLKKKSSTPPSKIVFVRIILTGNQRAFYMPSISISVSDWKYCDELLEHNRAKHIALT